MLNNVTDYFLELISIDSESRNERKVADRIKQDLELLGFNVEEDNSNVHTGGNAGNIYAFLEGDSNVEPILFCAHIDTVKPGNKINPDVSDGIIRTDGKTVLGADDKSGVAQIIFGIKKILNNEKCHPPIEVLFTVCEEIGLLGARYFDKSKIKSKFGFALDSEEVGEFMVGAPSQNTIRIKIIGKEAHAGVEPEKGINAIKVAAEAITAIPIGRIDFETTSNIGLINGGTATNIVPNLVELKGETRSHNEVKLARVTEDIVSAFQKAAARHRLASAEAKVEIDVHNEYKSFYLDESHKVVKIARRACELHNIEPRFMKGGGGSDANILNAHGIDMIIAGTGMHGYHTIDENISIKDLETGSELVSEIISLYMKPDVW